MKLLRNTEILTELLIDLGLTLIAALIGLLIHPLALVLTLLLGLALTGLHLLWGARRYRRIEALSQDINRILHDQQQVLITDSREGELSILYSELNKMTLRLAEQAEQLTADKMQLTDAIADIFHQIRTPLTSIHVGLAMLREPSLDADRRIALVHELTRQTERIRWLVETLLKLSKLDAGTAQFYPETIGVRALLDRAAAPLLIPMELRGQTLQLPGGSEQAICDPAWTAEALGNLLKNAMEHTPAGGTISVAAHETPLFTELTFTDSGEGFDPDDLPHLFERYYRGKNAAPESIGIGLALTRQVLAAQDATIAASNLPSGGAQFVVRFYKATV